MKKFLALSLTALTTLFSLTSTAAVPSPEKLLPDDTLLVFTIPDFSKAREAMNKTTWLQFWNDESMKGFREKFASKFSDEVLKPAQDKLGIKYEDYYSLPQGQLTVAVISDGVENKPGGEPAWLLLLDSGDKSADLKKRLAELKQKVTDSGKKTRADKIRDVDFTTILIPKFGPASEAVVSEDEEDDDGNAPKNKQAKPKRTPKPPAPPKELPPEEVIIGQVDSLLIAGSSQKVIEKILVRLNGGTVPTLSEVPLFEADHNKLLRNNFTYLWANVGRFMELVMARNKETAAKRPPNPMAPTPDKILGALGLYDLTTAGFTLSQNSDGTLWHAFIGAPAEKRKGLLKILSFDQKDAAPPAFVPADAVRFGRYRIDGQKAWAGIEAVIADISPQMSGLLQMSLSAAGKEQDPNFDLKKSLIGNLGDDLIYFARPSREQKLSAAANFPSVTLLGSANPEQLVLGLKAFMALLPPPIGGSPVKDREFLGKKIYTVPLTPMPGPVDGKPVNRTFSFGAGGGYVAMSSDAGMVEDFLRSSQAAAKPLKDTPGLADAAQKIGGLNAGIFGYENYAETFKLIYESLRTDPKAVETLLPIPAMPGANPTNSPTQIIKSVCDFTLLPAFEKVAKYFTWSISTLKAEPDGLHMRVLSPRPEGLK